jgi:hypothetical protein
MLNKPRFACVLIALFMLVGGCARAVVDVTMVPNVDLPKPDMILIDNIAVTPADVRLDRGIMASVLSDVRNRKQTAEEVRVGRMVGDRVVERLIDRLDRYGIYAFRSSSGVTPSDTTAVITSQFVFVDQGNQTKRFWLGFGLGGSELRIRGQMFQNGRMIAKGETRTTPSLMPGLAPSVAMGSATGLLSKVGVAARAGVGGFSEKFLAGVDADARRTADAIAENIRQYYASRGWLAKQADASQDEGGTSRH